MSDFKRTFIGGYKKSAVDEAINLLNQKLEKAEANEKKALHKLENTDSKIAELQYQIAQLQLENEDLKKAENNNNNNQSVTNDIAKIYKRAYGAGYDIVCESKDTAVNFLQDIYTRFGETMEDTEATLAKYETIQSEINAAVISLNKSIGSVANHTSMILENAKSFSDIYGQMKDVLLSAVKDSENALKVYENYSSEFLAFQEAAANESSSSETPSVLNMKPKETKEPVSESAEPPIVTKEELEANNSSQTSDIADIPNSKETGTVAETPKIEEPTQASSNSGEFTQFGRKSKISSEDRNELIRKALLKNSGD